MRKLLLLLCLISFVPAGHSQRQLWGMTSNGGQNNSGIIFKTDSAGNSENVVYNFFQAEGATPMYTKPIIGANGKLYGMTRFGGTNGLGVIFEYDPVNGVYTKDLDFSGVADGANPYGSLMLASDGKMYGVTRLGGANNLGVIFQFDPVTHAIVNEHDFSGATDGQNPYCSLIQASNGKLYGVTRRGGANNLGVLFSFDPVSNTFTNLFDFSGTADGSDPYGALLQASDGNLYGLTRLGGASGRGVIYKYDIAAGVLTNLYDFVGNPDGQNPFGSLIETTNGNLYGLTSGGGANGLGTIFSYDPVGNTFTNLFDFTGNASGDTPFGDLLEASNGKLYGLTSAGGANGVGTIFSFNLTGNVFTNLFDMPGAPLGDTPTGSFVQMSNGKLYAMAQSGGVAGSGNFFEFDPVTSVYTNMFDFSVSANPFGSLVQASDNMLYGLTQNDGVNGAGTLFQIDPSTGVFVNKHDLSPNNDGQNPTGTLIQATDGKLYGLTQAGGANGIGTIFSFDPVANVFVNQFDFNGGSGDTPFGSPIQATNGLLYGLTSAGGANGFGTIFSFDPVTGTCTNLFDFNGGGSGDTPFGSLLQATNGKLYGLTSAGGANGLGTLFSFDPATSTFTNLFDFNGGGSGDTPFGSLIQGTDGLLYGLSSAGGANGFGTIFTYDPATSAFANVFDFTGAASGDTPLGTLKQAANGKMYGLTSAGGANGIGTIFEFDPVTSTFTNKLDFSGINGDSPQYTHLIEITVMSTAGIGSVSQNMFRVEAYPNPAHDVLNVELPASLQGTGNISIENALGDEVYFSEITQSKITLPLTSLKAGIYFLKVESRGQVVVRKIVVQ